MMALTPWVVALGSIAFFIGCEGPPLPSMKQTTAIQPLPPVSVSTAAADESDPKVLEQTFAERAKMEITEENVDEVAAALEKEIRAELE